ncbi:SET-binding protein [Engraulis encrasicolus]|uniref:SET-binding protein n=1 Tax=Engraulis encrasicolus TaxID=184585 RepID=UPI002FD08FFF
MEQRELARVVRPKGGGGGGGMGSDVIASAVDYFPTASTINRAMLAELTGGASLLSAPLITTTTSSSSSSSSNANAGTTTTTNKHLLLPEEQRAQHGEDEDRVGVVDHLGPLGRGRDADSVDVGLNADSVERWPAVALAVAAGHQPGELLEAEAEADGDGLEDQEFSIKEASFQEGSLKLKIQTTKRAKKPPKNLENYICPPEIRITIKPPGEQRQARHGKSGGGGGGGGGGGSSGSGSSKATKEEDKVPPKKKTYERVFRHADQSDKETRDERREMLNVHGAPMKPKHERKNSDHHQVDWTKPPAPEPLSRGHATDLQTKTDFPCGNNSKSSQSESNATLSSKLQAKKGMEGSPLAYCGGTAMPFQFADPQISSSDSVAIAASPDSNILMHSPLSKDRGLQGVTEQVFGNIKRKYGRRDPIRTLGGGCHNNADTLWSKKAEKGMDFGGQESAKERHMCGLEKAEAQSVEVDSGNKRMEDPHETKRYPSPQPMDESRHRKRKNRKVHEGGTSLNDAPMMSQVPDWNSSKAEQGGQESRELMKEKTAERSPVRTEADSASVNVCKVDSSTNRQRRNPVGRPRTVHDPSKPTERRQSKIKDRWSYLNSPNPHKESCPVLSIEDPPSAYPITPASPLYTNTDSLTVITPVKKKRGRPKKQPLLTVETIHEGTATSPISPIAQDTLGANKRKRTHDLSDLVKLALNNPSPPNQLKLNKTNHLGVFKKKSVKKMKLVKMQSILNELFSGSCAGSLALKPNAPASSAVSTMASTIEARLGKQINVSKRGTIYIGKKRGRKPRADLQAQRDEHKDKHPSLSVSSQFENLVVPSSNPSTATGMPSPRVMLPLSPGRGGMLYPSTHESNQQDLKTMPNLQPISALPAKAPRGLLSGNWKLSPPRLLANSPSHLSEVASVKEVTLSPISESHSEETIPSDSGIGTDNNSTSDQTEKGPASRRRYSFDFCSYEAVEGGGAALDPSGKAMRGHFPKSCISAAAVEKFLAQESMKKQKHRRKRKGLQRGDDMQFLASLEELITKFQVFRISHRSYNFYRENSYPSIFRVNFDHHYYPMPYLPYDPVHYLRRNSEKSKKRRGRPAKSNEPMMRMPFIQGFGYPMPGGNYYAPYAMPYTSMPLATSMMNMGYYGQYPPPFYLPHGLGAAASPFMRPQIPPPKFHSGAYPKLATVNRHRAKSIPHTGPSKGLGDPQPAYMTLKGSNNSLASVCLLKRKHKHKHKHKDDQYSVSETEDLGGLFSGTNNPAFRNLLNERMEKDSSLAKLKEKQRNQQSTSDALSRKPRNFFEVDPLSTLSLSDAQQCKQRVRGGGGIGGGGTTTTDSFRNMCARPPFTFSRPGQEGPMDLFAQQRTCDDALAAAAAAGLRNQRHSFPGYRTYREGSSLSFQSLRPEETKQLFHGSSSALPDPGSSVKRRYKRKEIEEIQCKVRKMRAFSKILNTKKNLDHVNKILRVKRLQRQAKTGNNFVKRRRGRPRKQPLSQEEEDDDDDDDDDEEEDDDDEEEEEEEEEQGAQMPVLEKCVDLPGKRGSMPGSSLVPEPLEFSNHDSIMDAIESVVHKARLQPNKGHHFQGAVVGVGIGGGGHPTGLASKQWQRASEEFFAPDRPRRNRTGGRKEDALPAFP